MQDAKGGFMKKIYLFTVFLLLIMLTCCTGTVETVENELLPFLPGENLILSGDIYELYYTEVTASNLKYEMPDNALEVLDGKISKAMKILEDNYFLDVDGFMDAVREVYSFYKYINYMVHVSDILLSKENSEINRQNYVSAFNIYNETWDKIYQLYKAARKNPEVKDLINDFIDDKHSLISIVSGDPDIHDNRLTELEVEFLASSGSSEAELCELYDEFVSVSNALAECYGYENYYEYAHAEVFSRQCTAAERNLLRDYVIKYIVPLYFEYDKYADSIYDSATALDKFFSNRYFNSRFDSFLNDPLFSYIDSLPDSASKAMREAFELDRIIIGDSLNSEKTAFAKNLSPISFCYFHEDEMDLESVSHELGHYYSHSFLDRKNDGYDLYEIYALSNAFLLLSHMGQEKDSLSFELYSADYIANKLYQWILCTMKDEFDEIVYSTYGSFEFTPESLLEISTNILEKYGIADKTTSMKNHLLTYWRRQGMDDPCYNLNYSIALVSSFDIYLMSLTDYAGATELYCKLVEEYNMDLSLLENLLEAGLTTPFEEDSYSNLMALLEK